ncbi:hypothetical protein M422DRAFT_161927, partial [Sphaerobolus stellatus SS14]
MTSETQSHKGKKRIYIDNNTQRGQIEKLGRKFTYMNMLWLRSPDEIFCLNVDPDYNPANRFKSLDEQQQGILFELREEIPAKWHGDMEDYMLIRTFIDQMNVQRSNGSTRIRRAGPLIFNCSNQTFQNVDSRTATFRELIGFKLGEDGVGSYSTLAPILFKDYEGSFDKWKIFRNTILMKAYSALMRGIRSIEDPSEGDVTTHNSHQTVESKWGVRRITPGAIAMATVYARFTASEDMTFQPVGSETKIDYQSDFEYYLKYLHKGLQSKSPSVIDIFTTWNKEFY